MEAVAVLVAVAPSSRVVAEAEAKFDKLKRFCNFVSDLQREKTWSEINSPEIFTCCSFKDDK